MGNKSKNKPKKNQYLSLKLSNDPRLLEALDTLFDLAPPSFLRKSITEIFFSYLCNTEAKDYKPGLKEMATDFFVLIQFLETAEILEKNIFKK